MQWRNEMFVVETVTDLSFNLDAAYVTRTPVVVFQQDYNNKNSGNTLRDIFTYTATIE